MGRICMCHAVLYQDIEVVAINELVTKFRSIPVHGNFKGDVHAGKDGKLHINNKPIHVFSKIKPEDINWGSVGADYIIASSVVPKKVIITAISDAPTFVCGVNLDTYKPEYTIISSASSTINCIAPIAKLVHDKFSIEEVFMSSIRAVDVTDNKSVANNIIPTYTEVAEVVRMIIPSLDDKFTDLEFRIPVVNASVIDLVVKLKRTTTYHAITAAMKEAEEGPLKGTLSFMVLDRSFKLVTYYANDWAYLKRVCDLLVYVAKKDVER
ncbi:uncharacterized protein BJ212DRAFT_1450122 [Suillus subaureus]|uniref:glyceraldehyde-3-phosphate dehydrogenase (phosphorylating) n=1 Tax=Suillus subaureus TaxID=48587 RepID=A0A9P7DRC1_9AGAM|nr:uncharacterized protein BJ212DRAFT_1450122 [Suillus subaureus]KAG1801094.1 hypothetical protein BJ212DRAFT_1450122 [Suillus subaureus]